jgi:hypothetical protein
MDTLHTVMRSLRGETKSPRDHLSVFREFLHHLDRVGKRAQPRGRQATHGPTANKAAAVKRGRTR